MLDHQLYNF